MTAWEAIRETVETHDIPWREVEYVVPWSGSLAEAHELPGMWP
jgi:hypothetical protein